MNPHAYTEDQLVEQPAIGLFAALGWQKVSTTQDIIHSSNSHQAPHNSHQPVPDSHQFLATIPSDLRARIPPAGSKPRRDVLRALIVDLCRWRALSARDLATILHGREHKPLVRDYLSPMVAEGLLAYTIPEMENHPDQQYTVPPEAKSLETSHE